MKIRWYGQSAFLLSGANDSAVLIDPFGDLGALTGGRVRWEYPPVENVEADLLLITHEHGDHNCAEAVVSEPQVIRSTAGRFDTAFGSVVAIASEHDDAAGTQRGPNTIFSFPFDGFAICHFGDFGQAALRPEQREAIGEVDVLLLPVGDGPTVGGARAAQIVRELEPKLVVPHHYRTPLIDFLDPPDAFLEALSDWPVERLETSEFEFESLGEPRIVLPAPPATGA
jgi:L-ascorbate metabolism protein UlaG (beta-lactamase superfamily)